MALITSAVVIAASAVYTGVQQRKAAKATRKAQRAQERQAELAAARERRSAIRNARVAQGSIESQAATTGLVGSTAAAGSAANVTSRTAENLSFMDQTAALSAKASRANAAAAQYSSNAQLGQTVGNAAKMTAGMYG